jgi:hypothetical protein
MKQLHGMGVEVDDKRRTWARRSKAPADDLSASCVDDAPPPTSSTAPEAVAFIDTDGDCSTLALKDGAVQWWCNGRCFSKDVIGLVLLTSASTAGGDDATEATDEMHTLTTTMGQPRAVVAVAGAPSLLADLVRITAASGTTLEIRSDNEGDGALSTSAQPAPARHRQSSGGKRKQESRRAELQARLLQLRPPCEYASVSAPLAGMSDVLLQLRCNSHDGGSADVKPYAGILWAKLPPVLSMFSELDEGTDGTGAVTTAAEQQRRCEKRMAAGAKRLERKQRQCDAFASAIAALNLPDQTLVADFGCGSCGLTLPLAWAFPALRFVGIDIKRKALDLMESRALVAGLENARTYCGSVASFSEAFGLAIALHACGQASDEAGVQAVRQGAPYLVAPCCVGKLKFSLQIARDQHGGLLDPQPASWAYPPDGQQSQGPQPEGAAQQTKAPDGAAARSFVHRLQMSTEGAWTRLTYPRSRWLARQLGEKTAHSKAQVLFAELAAGADFSEMHGMHGSSSGGGGGAELGARDMSGEDAAFFRTCAIVVGLDRNEFAAEAAGHAYETRLRTMPGLDGFGKSDLLIGWVPRRKD